MDLVIFGLGTTTATRLGGNGRQLVVTFELRINTGTRLGGNGRQRRHREATGGNGFGNFRAKDHHWDMLGRQRESMDFVIFGLGTITATRLGGNGRHWIW